jgi:uncharacterized ion transporter superfamily protein YfcC
MPDRVSLPEPPIAGFLSRKTVPGTETRTLTKQRTLDPLLLLGSIIVLATILTWVFPAGQFERKTDPQTHRIVVVPGSYKSVPQHPIGPWGALVSIPEGLVEAGEVVFFVLLAGGALTVVEATGAIGSLLNHLLGRFGGHPLLVLGFASALFLIGGASNNMYEEILAFLPLLCALVRRLGLNHEMALAISVGTAVVAGVFSPFNTFTLGISQPMAQVALFSGFAFRSVVFVLAIGVWSAYLGWYALRSRVEVPAADQAPTTHAGKWKPSDIWVLVAMNAGMASMILGGVFLHWELRHFSAIFVLIGLFSGLAGGLGWRGTSEQFAEGFRRMVVAAALVGFARSISVVLRSGLILDTIASALFSPLRHLSLGLSAATMVVSESVLAFPMPSDSGRAMMSLPVIIPLADLLGLSRQMVVVAYQYSGLVSGLITPTAGALLAMLAVAGISYGRWLQFIMVPFVLLFALALVAIVAGVNLGIQ